MMEFLELAKKRYAARSFKPEQPAEEMLLQIAEAGRVAPTAANKQPQRVILIQSKEGMEKLRKGANHFNAPAAFIVCADNSQAWVRSYDNKGMGATDSAIVTTHMMLMADALGLGTCWITYFDPEVIRAEFNIPDQCEPFDILIVGYPDKEAPSANRHEKTRKPLAETLIKETF